MSVADNIAEVKHTIGHHPVKLIAVTKGVPIAKMQEAIAAGVTEFGENRLKEALQKQGLLHSQYGSKINWHFIGHLQGNKVGKAVGQFALIHSVDTVQLAKAISKSAQKLGIIQPILLQVKVLSDPQKSGFSPEQLLVQLPEIMSLPALSLRGLMTIAPLSEDPTIWHQSFAGLRNLRDELQAKFKVNLSELSMGMTQDWREAVACGSTMLRLGRAIFGS